MLIEISVSRALPAPPATAYAIIADYRDGHPRILPDRWFGSLAVERGGTGAGTRIRFRMKGFGPARELVADVEEPEPGRVLVERYPETGGVTTFTVEPAPPGCTVTITTSWRARGLRGLLEGLLAPRFLRRVFEDELDLLARVATEGG